MEQFFPAGWRGTCPEEYPMLLVCPAKDWKSAVELKGYPGLDTGDPTPLIKHIARQLGLVYRVNPQAHKFYLDLPRGGGREIGTNPGRAVNVRANQVVGAALNWVGRDFAPGEPAMCMGFVRHIFESVGVNFPIVKHPYDEPVCNKYDVVPLTAFYLANSLSGEEIGKVFTSGKPRAGDILFWAGTYFPDGVDPRAVPNLITHVGICSDAGLCVDRSTSSHPVTERPISTFSKLACYVRPNYKE